MTKLLFNLVWLEPFVEYLEFGDDGVHETLSRSDIFIEHVKCTDKVSAFGIHDNKGVENYGKRGVEFVLGEKGVKLSI